MFAGKKSAQIREILISESAWEEMTCLFAPSLGLGNVTNDAQLKISSNLSDVANVSTARANLGLGTAAQFNVGNSGNTVPLLNGANSWSQAQTFPYISLATAVELGSTTNTSTPFIDFHSSGNNIDYDSRIIA